MSTQQDLDDTSYYAKNYNSDLARKGMCTLRPRTIKQAGGSNSRGAKMLEFLNENK